MSRKSPRAVLLPASLFLLASSIVFGLAHGPGYGDWKIAPVAVAGLAMGYLFLRHGLHVAIMFHFATDAFIATYEFVGGSSSLGIAMNLGFFLLLFPGGSASQLLLPGGAEGLQARFRLEVGEAAEPRRDRLEPRMVPERGEDAA